MVTKKQKDQLYGIKDNLVSGIPRAYGRGEHHVKLAYITPEEASILKKLDLYDSNPPHDGPKGIPNYNDGMGGAPGQGDAEAGGQASGTAGDAAAHGNVSRSGYLGSKQGPVSSKSGLVATPRSEQNAVSQQQRNFARNMNALQMNAIRSEPSLSMSDYSPSTMGGLNATDGLSFGESMGYNMAGIKDAIGNMGITKGGIMGSAIAAMLGLGPLAGIALGQIGKSYSDKPEGEPGFFGQLGQNVRSDLSSMFGKAPEGEKRSLMDRL